MLFQPKKNNNVVSLNDCLSATPAPQPLLKTLTLKPIALRLNWVKGLETLK